MDDTESGDQVLDVLKERAKELNCLYHVEELLCNPRLSLPEILQELVRIIPSGWQFPELCRARIVFQGVSYQSPDYRATVWTDSCDIVVNDRKEGRVDVSYVKKLPPQEGGVFLDKERKLICTIGDRIGQTVMHRRMEEVLREWNNAGQELTGDERGDREWVVIVDLLRRTDPDLLAHLCRKMTNYLVRSGAGEYSEVMESFQAGVVQAETPGEENYPLAKQPLHSVMQLAERTFRIASNYLSDGQITRYLKRCIMEQKAYSLIRAVDRPHTPLAEILEAVNRYCNRLDEHERLSSPTERWLKVDLFRRFFSERLEVLNIAKQHIDVSDFHGVVNRMIFPEGSHGKLGGKSTGVFLAHQILRKAARNIPDFSPPATPTTWYMTTDTSVEFLHYNNLEELNEQKYKDLYEIRLEYPHIIQLLKNSSFPPGILRSLSAVLDDFGEVPLIVRSSSLLEDQMGAVFSGKYKSLFIANRGPKQARLEQLTDAVAEIYASVFSPDSIQYRRERGLLDFHEEMGIMIQEVVGTQIGDYYLPLYAGVGFSKNEFRWSPRIKREDGLARLVPGLGTRAVDRLSDDFPVLISPGQPGLRVNTTPDEVRYYSPRKLDVINLKEERFETMEVRELLERHSDSIPSSHYLVSLYREGTLTQPSPYEIDAPDGEPVVTFAGLVNRTPFAKRVRTILRTLEEALGTPVDIEFASDGHDFYLLQCRSQYTDTDTQPPPIPRDIERKDLVFTAHRHIANGMHPGLSHVVYVDPDEYGKLSTHAEMVQVGEAIGVLNSLLPKRQFVLMGPGRWGSRGDIKLGVQVTYADLNNTAVLVEIARQRGNYQPDLSFGTHFFQDLVESGIRYLPLYPDDNDTVFNESFLTGTTNKLEEIAPKYAQLAHVIRVIDVPGSAAGKLLRVLMNAELEEAVGYLCDPGVAPPESERTRAREEAAIAQPDDAFSRWRMHMAERIAAETDPEQYGVQAMYLFGSANSGSAGPASDIDLLVHFAGTEDQRARLTAWFEGWSQCLAEINYLNTGYRSNGLLDFHIVTDEDIEQQSSYAARIGSVADPARSLPMKGTTEGSSG